MKTLFSVLISFLALLLCDVSAKKLHLFQHEEKIHIDPDANRNVSQLISSKGYPVENYDIQTEDGYILTIQRIPSGRNNFGHKKNQKKEAILLQHGLLSSAADWVMNYPNQSLGFLLADAGYDVWLGNVRGNTYAQRHVKYSIKSKQFWKFSFDEMAMYDLPAMIDFILKTTGQEKLYYVGHSQGTLIAFALLSEKAEYNDKIKMFMALGPVATVGYTTSSIRYLVPFAEDLKFFFELFGFRDFLPSNTIMKYLSELVCGTDLKFICSNLIFLLCGTDTSQLNQTRMPVYVAHSPAGTSTQNMIHFAQMIRSKTFQKYDYGRSQNSVYYNQTSPPQYRVENIKTPVALFWSRNDLLADPTDVGLLAEKLKNMVESYMVPLPIFNHLDFVWGENVVDILYNELFRLMTKF